MKGSPLGNEFSHRKTGLRFRRNVADENLFQNSISNDPLSLLTRNLSQEFTLVAYVHCTPNGTDRSQC